MEKSTLNQSLKPMRRTHFGEIHADLTLSSERDTILEQGNSMWKVEQQRWNVMGWLQLPSIPLRCSGRKQWKGHERSWTWEEGRIRYMVILHLFYLSPFYFCVNYQENKLVSPRKVCIPCEGTWWVISLYFNSWFFTVFSPMLMRKSEIASQWAHGGKPWSIHNMMSIKTLPFGSQKLCLSGQGRNNLRVKLSLSADSLEKSGR